MRKGRAIASSMLLGFALLPGATLAQTSQPASSSLKELLTSVVSDPSLLAAVSTASSTSQVQPAAGSEELIALTRPGIVRLIVHHTAPQALPSFTVDLIKRVWKEVPTKSSEQPLDTYATGSGFVVNPRGYIVTNTHVTSSVSLKASMAASFAASVYLKAALSLTEADGRQIESELKKQYGNDQEAQKKAYEKLVLDGVEFIKNKIQLNTPQIGVMRQVGPKEATSTSAHTINTQNITSAEILKDYEKAFKQAVHAEVVYENASILNDEKDVAVIKVEQINLPSLNLANTDSIQAGNQVFVFGYPDNTDRGNINVEPSFTSGTINALKDSAQNTFKYIQTDAKVSTGSSGGPLFNSTGEVVGILTQSTAQSAGDSFAFAVPLSVVREALAQAKVESNVTYGYTATMQRGIMLLGERKCEAALEQLKAAASMNNVFSDPQSSAAPYITECENLIASGQSLDSWFDEVMAKVAGAGLMFWILVGSAIVVVSALTFGIIFLIRKLQKDEALINKLGHTIEQPAPQQPMPVPQQAPTTPTPIQPANPVPSPVIKTENTLPPTG